MLLFFYWYLTHCQSVTELAILPPSASNLLNKNSYLAFARTNYIKKLIKNIIFMQVMIQTHQYMVDYLLLQQRLDG